MENDFFKVLGLESGFCPQVIVTSAILHNVCQKPGPPDCQEQAWWRQSDLAEEPIMLIMQASKPRFLCSAGFVHLVFAFYCAVWEKSSNWQVWLFVIEVLKSAAFRKDNWGWPCSLSIIVCSNPKHFKQPRWLWKSKGHIFGENKMNYMVIKTQNSWFFLCQFRPIRRLICSADVFLFILFVSSSSSSSFWCCVYSQEKPGGKPRLQLYWTG